MKNEIHFLSWDDRRDIAHPGDPQQTLAFCVEHFLNCAKEAIKLHGYFSVALAGGSTPKAMYQMLSKAPNNSAIDWTKVLLFWSDERSVAPTSPDSNFRMVYEAGFKNLSIPKNHMFRMEAEDDIEAHALAYENKIKEVLGQHPFDLMMLGMGDDGHTASLFPGTEALNETKRLVVASYVPQKNTWRMTMTYPLINRSRNIAIYVLGKGKKEMVSKIFLGKEDLPASRVGTPANKALWILDSEAGEEVLSWHESSRH